MKTVDFIRNFLHKHVESLNSIYNSLPFYNENETKYYIGLQFSIHRTKVIIHNK